MTHGGKLVPDSFRMESDARWVRPTVTNQAYAGCAAAVSEIDYTLDRRKLSQPMFLRKRQMKILDLFLYLYCFSRSHST